MPASTLVSASTSDSARRARSAASSASAACPLRAVLDHVAVAVEDVVDDLEEQAELVREGPPRRLLRLRHLGHPERARDRGREQAAGLQPVQRGQVVAAAVMSRYWPSIIPSVACTSSRATAGDGVGEREPNASASSASPARIATASP